MKSKLKEVKRARKQIEKEDLEYEEIRPRSESRSPSKKETTGSDLSDWVTQGRGLITPCPNDVLADVERLEILIGGKRAGNTKNH